MKDCFCGVKGEGTAAPAGGAAAAAAADDDGAGDAGAGDDAAGADAAATAAAAMVLCTGEGEDGFEVVSVAEGEADAQTKGRSRLSSPSIRRQSKELPVSPVVVYRLSRHKRMNQKEEERTKCQQQQAVYVCM